jgi:signal recognition particle receptor subunit beta
MNEYKLVFTGTTGAGKTTAISAISEIAPINTDVDNSDDSFNKLSTTVGFDYGQITLANGDRVRLFGTPGQMRFDFMWKILIKDAFGLIILVDNSRPDPLADLDIYLDGFSQEIQHIPCAIGVGRTETVTTPSLDDYSSRLAHYGLIFPVLPIDVRKVDDVAMLIEVLMLQAEADLT